MNYEEGRSRGNALFSLKRENIIYFVDVVGAVGDRNMGIILGR